jgi:hypothetical protein
MLDQDINTQGTVSAEAVGNGPDTAQTQSFSPNWAADAPRGGKAVSTAC